MNPYQIETNGETVTADHAERSRLWLVSWLSRRPEIMARVFTCYQQLKRRPAAWRRRLTRSAAVTLGGAALLLALSVAPVSGRNIKVANGEVEIRSNGKCSLIEAIRNANNTVDGQPHDDCAPGNPNGADTISLPEGGQFILKEAHNTGDYGANGLPWISSEITIEGNDSIIISQANAPQFRILPVGSNGRLFMRDATLRGARFGSNDKDVGGGAILNLGKVTLEDCVLVDNVGSTELTPGGAIHTRGEMTILRCDISGNSARPVAGAILNSGDLSIVDSILSENRSWTELYEYYVEAGGAILSHGTLTITGSRFEDNHTWVSGGAIDAEGHVHIEASSFVDNEAIFGGAIDLWSGNMTLNDTEFLDNRAVYYFGGDGGAIWTGRETVTTLENCTISGNEVLADYPHYKLARGGGISNQGHMTVRDSTFAGNSAIYAGGIYNWEWGEIVVLQSSFLNNSSSEQGGAIDNRGTLQIVDSIVSNNHVGYYDGLGGAIFNDGDLTVAGSTLEQNEVSANFDAGGGAISNHGQCVLESSTLSGNRVSGRMAWGGAIDSSGPLTIDNVSILDNEVYGTDGAAGGGLNAEAVTTITRSTVARNSVTVGDPSRPAEANLGGGISSSSSALSISETTLSDNSASVGGGLASRGKAVLSHTTISKNRGGGVWAGCRAGREAGLTLVRNLISGNEDREVVLDLANECDIALSVNGHNLFGVSGMPGVNFELGPTDFVPDVGIDKILAPLADNGGPTWTHALVRRSPAIDAAPSAACEGMTDQRGYPRNVDGDGRPSSKECDVGAFEYGAKPPETPTPTATVTIAPSPTSTPTAVPSATPTTLPTGTPTTEPTQTPTVEPTATPTVDPSATVTIEPTLTPTAEPSPTPTSLPELNWQIIVPFICR